MESSRCQAGEGFEPSHSGPGSYLGENEAGADPQVICGMADSPLSCFTAAGSLVINRTTHRSATRAGVVAERTTSEQAKPCCPPRMAFQSAALVPIRRGGRDLGVIHVADPRQDVLPPTLIETLESLGRWLGETLGRLRENSGLRKTLESLSDAQRTLENRLAQRTVELETTRRALQDEVAHGLRQKTLREQLARLEVLSGVIPHGVVETNAEGIITFANSAFRELVDRSNRGVIGTYCWDWLASEAARCEFQGYFQFLVSDQPTHTPHIGHNCTSDGREIDIRVDWDYRRDRSGELTGFVAVVTEITGQRCAEEQARRQLDQLAHLARLSTMGEVVSGLAHELNQPLAAIANYAHTCYHLVGKLVGDDRDTALDIVQQIAGQADRAGTIIRHLRGFVRRAETNRTPTDINELVQNVATLLEGEARLHDIRLHLALNDCLPPVTVVPIQIEQVIANLVSNAMEATHEVPKEDRRVTVRTWLHAEGRLAVAVEDTGEGLEGKVDRLFEPFYTTKEHGMGLGLSISRSIVESHGGLLEGATRVERGAVFRFILPIWGEEGVMETNDEQRSDSVLGGR